MKLASLLLFMGSLTGVSLTYTSYTKPPPPGVRNTIKEMICENFSPEMIAIKCKDPEFVHHVREHSIDGISPEELCSDPHGVLSTLCSRWSKVYTKSQQQFHMHHRDSYGQMKAKV